jgi:hypothetical protein
MPKTDRTTEEFPSEALLLAAIERAQRHQSGEDRPVVFGAIVDHLGLPRGSWTTRRLRPKVDALEAAGLVQRVQRQGFTAWELTPNGRQWLATLRRSGDIGALPEAPQHRQWRKARDAAAERISEFHAHASQTLADAAQLLEASSDVPSERWFEMSQRLGHSCWRLGSSTYCLREWTEPDDATFDVDKPPTLAERGRRETQRWNQSSWRNTPAP